MIIDQEMTWAYSIMLLSQYSAQYIAHFRGDLPSQSLDWYKTPNHLNKSLG